jgi:hypothetical protein
MPLLAIGTCFLRPPGSQCGLGLEAFAPLMGTPFLPQRQGETGVGTPGMSTHLSLKLII